MSDSKQIGGSSCCASVLAPHSLTLELKADVLCPSKCVHCSHVAAHAGEKRELDLERCLTLAREAAELGVLAFVAYPRRGDVSLESERYSRLFSLAKHLGMRTKTTSAAVDPEGLASLVPHLDQITISIDGFDAESFSRFRPKWLLARVEKFLDLLEDCRPAKFLLAVNVVVTKSFIENGGIEQFVEDVVSRRVFDKVNFLEILPAAGEDYAEERLGNDELRFLRALKKRSKPRIRITVPSWEPGASGVPSCPLGRDFVVIGPEGDVAACVLLLHGGLVETNILQEESLASAWEKIRVFAHAGFRDKLFCGKSGYPESSDLEECRSCGHFKSRRCFGGCVARVRLYGHPFERSRQCQGPVRCVS